MIYYRHFWIFLTTLSFATLISCDSRSSSNIESEAIEQADANPSLDGIAKLQGDVTFTLEDGELLNRENPDTFWIPPKDRRESLVRDDIVKLVFNLTDGKQTQGERMWVIVKDGDSSGYTGILDNDAYSTDRIKAGLEVMFEPRHVIDIFDDEITNQEEDEGDAP